MTKSPSSKELVPEFWVTLSQLIGVHPRGILHVGSLPLNQDINPCLISLLLQPSVQDSLRLRCQCSIRHHRWEFWVSIDPIPNLSLEARHMKDWVNFRLFGQVQFVGHGSNSLKDLKGAEIPWGELRVSSHRDRHLTVFSC